MKMDPLVRAVRDSLAAVRGDGRVPRDVAARLRAAARDSRRQRVDAPARIVAGLAPFETLPGEARRSLHDMVRRDDWWSMWLRRAAWRHALVRAARTLQFRVARRSQGLRNLIDRSESLFLMWHARAVHELYRGTVSLRGWLAREPTLDAALKIAGLDPRLIAAAYLRGVPQPADTAGYWHDPARQTTVGVVIGIDFIVNDEAVWFVESNLNAGLMEERSRLYDRDPFVENLVAFARQHGYSSLVFLACNDYPVDAIMAARIEETARAAGLRATVLEDRHAPQGRLGQTFLVPRVDDGQTLVVRSKLYHTALDWLFHNKTLSLHALETYQSASGDRDVRLPPTGVEAFPDVLPMDGPFPNLVCKFPERDQGQGVVFLKVPSLAWAESIVGDQTAMNRVSVANLLTKLRYSLKLEDQTGIFQSYVPSSLLEGRRLFIARAHVLATPVGLKFLSAHRVVSKLPIPDSLPEGLVEHPRPYIVNYSLDSEHAAMPPDEELRVSKAAMSVARGLCWAVEARFQTTPGTEDAGRASRPA